MLKAFKVLPIAVVALISVSASASSNLVSGEKEGDTGFYAGIKTGSLDISVPGYDTEAPLGIHGGYEFGNGFAVELEYNRADLTFGSLSGELTSLAAYGVYRTQGDFYGKFKVGILSEELSFNAGYSDMVVNDSGISGGVGAGYRFNDQFSAEMEYTYLEPDANLLSVGINYHF